MAYDVGTAFVSVVPSFDNTQRKISQFFSRMKPLDIPMRLDPRAFSNEVQKAAQQAARDTSVDLGRPKLDMSNVAREISQATKGAQVVVEANLDTSLYDARVREMAAKRISIVAKIDADIAGLRAKLDELAMQTPSIRVDLETTAAEAKIRALEAEKHRVQIQVDADAERAMAELLAVDRELGSLDGKTANVNVESSSASRAIGIMALLTAGIAAAGFAAPAAAAAIAAIGPAISVAGQGIATLLAAFNGIGDAVKAYQAADDQAIGKATRNATARTAAANQVASAQSSLASAQASADQTAVSGAEQVQAARTSLANAQLSLAQAQETALRRTADAERTLTEAQRAAKGTQDALNDARKEAQQRIEDLGLSLKGTALDEESAALALERALKKLQALKDAGATTGIDYREADLNARQAAQRLDEVRKRYVDLQKQAAYAAKTGVEGDKAVIAAHKTADAATGRVADAERSLAQTRADGARQVTQAQAQVAQSTQAVAKAQEHAAWANEAAVKAVADAQRSLGAASQKAGEDGTAAMDKLHLALSKLTPEGRAFALFLQRDVKPALHQVGDAVQKALLPQMQTAIGNLITLAPELTTVMTGTADAIGRLAVKGSEMVTSGPWRADFLTIGRSNNQIMESLGEAGLSIADAFRNITVAAGPMLEDFAGIAEHAAAVFAAFIQGKRDNGELNTFFHDMGGVLKTLFGVFKDVAVAVWDLGAALGPFIGGGLIKLIDSLAKMLSGFATAHPILTNIIATIGLAAAAFIFLGRGIIGTVGAFKKGSDGIKLIGKAFGTVGGQLGRFHGQIQRVADGTGRLAGAADAVAHPMARARQSIADLAKAYRDGDRATRDFLSSQSRAQGAPKADGGDGGASKLSGIGAGIGQMGSRLAELGTKAQAMASKLGAAATSAASSLLTRMGPASIRLTERMDDVGAAVSRTTSALGIRLVNGLEAARNPAALLERAMAKVSTSVENAGERLRAAFTPSVRDTSGAMDGGTSAAGRMGDAIRTRLSSGAKIAGDSLRGIGTAVRDGLTNAAGTASSAAGNIGTRIRDALSKGVTEAHGAIVNGMSKAAGAFENGFTRIAGAAGGAASAIGKGLVLSVVGITEALGGPFALAIIGATLLMSYFANKSQEAAQKSADYKKDVDSLTEAYKQSGGSLDENIISTNNKALADKDLAANARAAGSSFEIYAAAANGNATALDLVTQASDNTLRSIAESAGMTQVQTDALVGVGREALNTGQSYSDLKKKVGGATETLDDMGQRLGGLTDEQAQHVEAILNGNGATGEQIKKNKEARDAYVLLEAAASKVTTTTIELWEAQKKQSEVTKELTGASLSLRDAQADLHDSQKSIVEAQKAYTQAVKDHGAKSKEATDAADTLADAKRREEHSILSLLDAAQRESEARNAALPQAERDVKSVEARNKALLDVVKTYKGPLPQAVKDSIKGMDLASASAAGFTTTINDFGDAIVKLPDGTEIKIDADPANARTKIDATVTYANGKTASVTLFANIDPATGQTQFWQRNADGTVGKAKLDAVTDPATGKVQIWQTFADGTRGLTNLDAFTDPADGKVKVWKDAADHTKGWATLDANTDPATDKLKAYKTWVEQYLGHLNLTIDPKTPAPGDPPLPFHNAIGNLLEFFAGGGFKKLTSMGASVATVVPPNTMRVIGDRAQGDEAFIPINREPRSIQILMETAKRMGFAVSPLALGGLLGLADGAVTAPASSAPAPLAATTPDASASAASMTAAAAAATAFAAALATLQAVTIAFTDTALIPMVAQVNTAVVPALNGLVGQVNTLVVPALIGLNGTLPPLQAGFSTTSGVVAATTMAMSINTANSVAQIGGYLATLRAGLQITGQAFQSTSDWVNTSWVRIKEFVAAPSRQALGIMNQGLILAWNTLDSNFALNKHLQNIPIGFATGGPVNGIEPYAGIVPGVGNSDTVPALLTPGEFVWSKPAVEKAGGLQEMERLHRIMARGGDAAKFAGGGPVLAGMAGGANFQWPMAQTVMNQFPGQIRRISGFRPGSMNAGHADMHSMGKATDISADIAMMTSIARWIFNRFPGSTELIHANPNPADNLTTNLMNKLGHTGYWGYPHDIANHYDHVHWGLNDISILGLPPGVGANSFGAGTVDTVAVVNNAFAKTYKLIDGFANQFPGNHMVGQAVGVLRQAADRVKQVAMDRVAATSLSGGLATPALAGDIKAYQDYARSMLPRFGWGQEQMGPLIALWNAESGWNPRIENKGGSGAYGIPQALPGSKMASAGADWRTNASTQINWGLGYIKGRPDYGSPAAAWAAWQSRSPHWYDEGGWLPPGYSTVANHTGKPEAVLSADQWGALITMAGLTGGGGSGSTITVNARTDASPDHIAHVIDRRLSIGSRL